MAHLLGNTRSLSFTPSLPELALQNSNVVFVDVDFQGMWIWIWGGPSYKWRDPISASETSASLFIAGKVLSPGFSSLLLAASLSDRVATFSTCTLGHELHIWPNHCSPETYYLVVPSSKRTNILDMWPGAVWKQNYSAPITNTETNWITKANIYHCSTPSCC